MAETLEKTPLRLELVFSAYSFPSNLGRLISQIAGGGLIPRWNVPPTRASISSPTARISHLSLYMSSEHPCRRGRFHRNSPVT